MRVPQRRGQISMTYVSHNKLRRNAFRELPGNERSLLNIYGSTGARFCES